MFPGEVLFGFNWIYFRQNAVFYWINKFNHLYLQKYKAEDNLALFWKRSLSEYWDIGGKGAKPIIS